MTNQHVFASIDAEALNTVIGGRAISSGSSSNSDQTLQLMLTQLQSSIKEVAQSKTQQMDPMMMMMMTMMMGKGGGGGAPVAGPPPEAAPAPAQPNIVRVNVNGRRFG